MEEQIISYLKDLIALKTISGLPHQDEVIQLFEWVKDNIKDSGMQFRDVEYNGFHSLIIEPSESHQKRSLICTAHVDVVPGDDAVFEPHVQDGKLFGRGSSDMKFAVAVYVELINQMKDVLKQKNVSFILTSDEEIGGTNGTKALLEAGEFATDCVFLPDGGNNLSIVKGEKGVVHVKVTAPGKSAHASRPWEGVNPFTVLFNGYTELIKKFPVVTEESWKSTVTLTKVEGGDIVNKIPDTASIYLDIRFIEDTTKDQLIEKLSQLFSFPCVIEVLASGDQVALDVENSLVKQFEDIVAQITGTSVKYSYDHGASDARFFTETGIPVIMTRPLFDGQHSPQEWVDLKSLQTFSEVLRLFISSLP